jgi:hypothetical protein
MSIPRALLGMAIASALPSLAALLLMTPPVALAQNNNSYATMLQNTGMWQANLTKQMINLGGKVVGSGAGGGPAPCMPPYELQRGADGHVPPELQGDPRYQEYLRCQRYQPGPPLDGRPAAAAPAVPAPAGGQHLPITATDFVPAQPGHPVVDQAIVGMAITPQQRIQLRQAADVMFNRVASQYRGNNLAVSVTVAYTTAMAALNGSAMTAHQTRDIAFAVNDAIARHPQFVQMSALQKQNESDRLIFQSLVISLLSEMGQRDPQARQQAVQYARAVLKQLNVAA